MWTKPTDHHSESTYYVKKTVTQSKKQYLKNTVMFSI